MTVPLREELRTVIQQENVDGKQLRKTGAGKSASDI